MARVCKQNVRERILEAAERRLWHYGFKKTTIDEIAADAGVGKGTVYLYFESKEDISLAIFVGYKLGVLQEQQQIAFDPELDTLSKIRNFLLCPVMAAQTKCQQYPEALEIIAVLKPHLAEHMKPYLEQEITLLEKILVNGVKTGELCVDDPAATARSLKYMTLGFMPQFACVNGTQAVEREIGHIVQIAFDGLRYPAQQEPPRRRSAYFNSEVKEQSPLCQQEPEGIDGL